MSPQDEIPVIITLSDGIDFNRFKNEGKKAKRAKIISALRERAERTQSDLRSFLDTSPARRIKAFWIINGIAATVPAWMVSELVSFPGVENVDLDYAFHVPAVTYSETTQPEWNLNAIDVPNMWDLGYTGKGVVIANMDTGVDMNHADLKDKWRGGNYSWYDPHGEHDTPQDVNGHGTQTMGIMVGGSATGTAIGIAPDVQWIAVKIFNDADTSYVSTIHEAFQWLLDPDDDPTTDDAPDVVNASWGILYRAGECILEFEQDIQNLKEADIAVAFAAGNSGSPYLSSMNASESPANNPDSFAVGATDSNDIIAPFSSRGPSACDGSIYPHIVAPGVNIKTSDLTGGGMFPNSYAYVSGTSFAAPHAAGSIALLIGAFSDLSVIELESALEQSAADLGILGDDNDYGHGLINVAQAYHSILGDSHGTDIDVFPRDHNFGTVESGDTSNPVLFSMGNNGAANLIINDVSITGPDALEFKIIGDTCTGQLVEPLSACIVEAIFSPVTGGTKTANLTLLSNDQDMPIYNVSLFGTGTVTPPLTLTSPNGSEEWDAGTNHTVRWNYNDIQCRFLRIDLIDSNMVSRIITRYAWIGNNRSGSYNWLIPSNQTTGDDYRIRIMCTSHSSYTDTSDTIFTIEGPPPPEINVISPAGGENWQSYSTQTITWDCNGNVGTYLKIELLKGTTVISTITNYARTSTGSYSWFIPSNQAGGSDYSIRVTSTTNPTYTDTSADFSITGPPPPSIIIENPYSGESWARNSGRYIRWTYSGNPGNYVKIELLKGRVFNRVLTSYARIGYSGRGYYYWWIPRYLDVGSDYQIRITSTSNSTITALSIPYLTLY